MKNYGITRSMDHNLSGINRGERTPILRYTLPVAVIWTVIVAASLSWNIINERTQTRELVWKEADSIYDKDEAFRQWGVSHRGVYVVPNDRTPPNPYLSHLPDRDVVTVSGKKLTLMNPAYMMRQMMGEYSEAFGVKTRITSLKVLNPVNEPDEWERGALEKFDEGTGEVSQFVSIKGEPYFRLMRPMITKKTCLNCHSFQGYKVGDVRGGVDVSVPTKKYLMIERNDIKMIALTHTAIWIIGLAVMIVMWRREVTRLEENRKSAEKLNRTVKELRRSNRDLDRYAHVAAHDLQEPLRMVTSYMQIIERRYKGKLDSDADEYINYAVGGSRQMQKLIDELLDYSQLDSWCKEARPVDCSEIVNRAISTLKPLIDESGAVITVHPLPDMMADDNQLVILFQKLIENAVKYRGENIPKVHVRASHVNHEWVFSVHDNGIGIAQEHQEQIFVMFQRLHRREEYAGTGMGLAVCQKIIEYYDGRLWVESDPGQGSTFYFTLPVAEEPINEVDQISHNEIESGVHKS